MANWIRDAEAALSSGSSDDSIDVVDVHAPTLIDAEGARALLAPFLAGFMWAAAIFREIQTHTPLDPLALLLRVLALFLTLRALRLLFRLGRRVLIAFQRSRYGLVLTDGGLLYRSPAGDVVVPRSDIVDVREHGSTALGARTSSRWAEVYVVTHPDSPRLYISLPPLFRRGPRALSELLMRWRGPIDARAISLPDDPDDALPSKLWDRVVGGERPPGVVAIQYGTSWLKRGPYASMLLGCAVLDGYLRLPPDAQRALNPTPALLLATALVIVPAAWIVLMRARMVGRRGLSLLLTPTELLMRGRGGITRIAWSTVVRCAVVSRTSWSLLQGTYDARSLSLQRKPESNVQCAEAFMDVPVEVVAALGELYRKHAAPLDHQTHQTHQTHQADAAEQPDTAD